MEYFDTTRLAELNKTAHAELEAQGQVLGYGERVSLAVKAIRSTRQPANSSTPEKAREVARDEAAAFFYKLRSLGIPVNFENFDHPEVDNVSLWLINHQAFGLEAMGVYGLVPTDSRVMLKDDLVKSRIIGAGISAADPIVLQRGLPRAQRITDFSQAQRDTLENTDQSVTVFPEGTRVRDGNLAKFRPSTYAAAFETIQQMESRRQKIGIITADTFPALPFGVDPKVLVPGLTKGYQTPINFQLDVEEIDAETDLREFNTEIGRLVQRNLEAFAMRRLDKDLGSEA